MVLRIAITKPVVNINVVKQIVDIRGNKMSKQCTGKRQYSKMGALFSLASALDENNDNRPIRSYQCKVCKKWHLTSQKKGEFKHD